MYGVQRQRVIKQIVTLSRYSLLEAWYTHVAWLVVGILAVGYALAMFVGQIALTETNATQVSVLAAFLRLAAVYLSCLFVISSMVREQQQQLWFLWLSLPLSRSVYCAGRWLGYALLTLLISGILAVLLSCYAPIVPVLMWTVSLSCELLIMISISLLCVFTLPQTLPAFSLVAGFYLLARSINAIQLMADGVLLQTEQSLFHQTISFLISGLAFLLPDLSQFTLTSWLVYDTASLAQILIILGQTVIYVSLLFAASLFDLSRKNL